MILSGKKASEYYFDKLKKTYNFTPHLCAIQIGDNPASNTYLRLKKKKLEELNFKFSLIKFDENISEIDLIKKIEEINNDISINGILLQLPIPKHLDKDTLLNKINLKKDIDCLNSDNLGKFFIGKHDDLYPATAKGVIRLLEYYEVSIESKNICIIGRSNLVTKPLAIELINRNATVTICHSYTTNLMEKTKMVDIVITGIGNAKFLNKNFFNKNQTIIDIGTSLDENGKLVGDVDYNQVVDFVENITPVPGGVGPMTIYGLIENLCILTKSQQYND